MIRIHEFNTRWWGSPVGIVYDPNFFDLAPLAQQKLLNPFAWSEFQSPLDEAPSPLSLVAAGFAQADTQLRFILNLSKVETPACASKLECRFADDEHFTIGSEELAHFNHERFHHIPGCTVNRTRERYALWANDLIGEHPDCCIRLYLDQRPQGWFLSRPGEQHGLNLTLAMLSSDAEISGMLLYQQACTAFASRGHRLGHASFSATNTPVHNIYSTLGARFLPPSGNWLWVGKAEG